MEDRDLGVMIAGAVAGMAAVATGAANGPPKEHNDAVTFGDLKFERRTDGFGVYARTKYPNGYGASVVRGPYTYGGDLGLYEIAVMTEAGLCYTTPITDDVIGRLSEDDVTRVLGEIAALPPCAEVPA